MEYINPFELLKSEYLESTSKFHALYGSQMVDILLDRKDSLWSNLHIIRSAPGAGKTSLLRLFTTESLISIYQNRKVHEYQELYSVAKKLEAIDSGGVKILGVLLTRDLSYAQIEDLDIDKNVKESLFLTLLNARALMRILEAICFDNNVSLSNGLKDIKINIREDSDVGFSTLFGSGTGKILYENASRIERQICRTIDSVSYKLETPTVRNLVVWNTLTPNALIYKDAPINKQVLIMLDDVQYFAPSQRILIFELLQNALPVARWVAERYQALEKEEIIQVGAHENREYVIHRLEEWALENSSKNKFLKGLGDIANKRIMLSQIVDVSSFEALLQMPEADQNVWQRCKNSLEEICSRIITNTQYESRFKNWIEETTNFNGDELEKAIEWRRTQILIERKRIRGNSLFLDEDLPVEEMDKMDSSAIRNAARLFLCKEFDIPYYYGFDVFKALSSGNVEQFLQICGAEFAELVASATLKRSKHPILSCDRQQLILKELAKNRLDEIPGSITNGVRIKNLVLNIAHQAQLHTYRPTAPYAPGVTGIAISVRDKNLLCDKAFLDKNQSLEIVANVLSDALAYNILEMRPSVFCKQQEWVVLYLNRLYCTYYWLPLEYGGFKEQKIEVLSRWIEKPPSPGLSKKGLFADV